MKRFLLVAAVLALSTLAVHGQTVDTTVCEVLKNPAAFDGKTVRIKAKALVSWDQFVARDLSCNAPVNAIWLAYPAGTHGKAQPAVILTLQAAANFKGTVAKAERTAVTLDKGKDWKQFDSLLAAPLKTSATCLACAKNEVTATITGRLDAATPRITRNATGEVTGISGFGHMNMYSARLVISGVSDVQAQEIDYTKSIAASKGESVVDDDGKDGAAMATKAAAAFGAGSEPGKRITRALEAYGKPGEDNGVSVGSNNGGEWSATLDAASSHHSPDGVMYNVTIDMNRIKGNQLSIAMTYAGALIAHLREVHTATNPPLADVLNDGWASGLLVGIGKGLKTITMTGDNLLWNNSWAGAEREPNAMATLSNYLLKVEGLGK